MTRIEIHANGDSILFTGEWARVVTHEGGVTYVLLDGTIILEVSTRTGVAREVHYPDGSRSIQQMSLGAPYKFNSAVSFEKTSGPDISLNYNF